MLDYKKLYFQLFGALAEAEEAIEALNFGLAKEILIRAQQNTEEQYIADKTDADF